jgi:photosystem II stability/assembly factor-like uncharacterized protein
MDTMLILASSQGVILCRQERGEWVEVGRGLNGQAATSVIAREGVILAGTRAGVFRCDDVVRCFHTGKIGNGWEPASQGLANRHVRWLAYHPNISDLEFCGTEPAAIYVSYDGAQAWRPCPEVAELRDRLDWYLPYSPESGCVRGFAFHGARAYAAVEVGGVLRSNDSGETWGLAGGSSGSPQHEPDPSSTAIHPDVHSIAVHPASPDLVSAPTGGGFYRSWDGGLTWKLRYDCYCRAVWLDPADPDHLILGPAEGVDRLGRIEATRDGGQTWRAASAGLDVPWSSHMVERFTQVGEELLAVLSNGELLAAPLATLEWRRILPSVRGVAAVAVLEF